MTPGAEHMRKKLLKISRLLCAFIAQLDGKRFRFKQFDPTDSQLFGFDEEADAVRNGRVERLSNMQHKLYWRYPALRQTGGLCNVRHTVCSAIRSCRAT